MRDCLLLRLGFLLSEIDFVTLMFALNPLTALRIWDM